VCLILGAMPLRFVAVLTCRGYRGDVLWRPNWNNEYTWGCCLEGCTLQPNTSSCGSILSAWRVPSREVALLQDSEVWFHRQPVCWDVLTLDCVSDLLDKRVWLQWGNIDKRGILGRSEGDCAGGINWGIANEGILSGGTWKGETVRENLSTS